VVKGRTLVEQRNGNAITAKGLSTAPRQRINAHFFGPPPGKKAQIIRCSALQSDRAKYKELYAKVRLVFTIK
jgi:hypothetical protein